MTDRREHPLDGRMSALVVEDSPVVGKLVVGLLKELGFQRVDHVLDGAEALERLREHPYRLVISDFVMMPLSGLDLLKLVRADSRLQDTCFLMMSAATDVEQVTTARDAGADGYLLKPFAAATLKQKMDEAFQRRLDEKLEAALARRPRARPRPFRRQPRRPRG